CLVIASCTVLSYCILSSSFFFLTLLPPPTSTLFPYTTLFRSFLILLVTFRSLVIPIKAIVLNLLSVAASYGVLESRLSTIALIRSEEHTSELQSLTNLVCRLLLENKTYHPPR